MSSHEFVKLALQLATMLLFATLFGELMRRRRQPAVVGEMVGGIILGPTVLGLLAPEFYRWLFLAAPAVASMREAFIKFGMLFFLFFAGLQVNLSDLRDVGRRALLIGVIGTLVPIGAGVALVYAVPRDFWGVAVQKHFVSFALFIGMNLANSANPVIARVLLDLGLLNQPIGTLIMTATLVDDLVNWTLFAIILGDIAPTGPASGTLGASVVCVAAFVVLILALGRLAGPPVLRLAKRHLNWPGGFIAVTAVVILLASTITEAAGVHAFLGAFLAGVALGRSRTDAAYNEAHDLIGTFVGGFFAPIYFISMGMTTDFIANFDGVLVALVFIAACVTKLFSVLLGAKAAGMPINRQAWAIAFGLNARGATGIILAGVGLANKVIDERVFVGIAVMALGTSIMSGPVMRRLLNAELSHAPDVKPHTSRPASA